MNTATSNYGLITRLFYVSALLILSGSFIGIAEAEGPVIRSGETVGIEAGQLLEGDFYGLGQTITISGEATRDVYALGGAVTTNGPVEEDLVVIGGVVQIHGEIKDDARIIGGEVIIAEPVGGDVVVIGGSVHILSTATLAGDLIFFGGEIIVDGPIEGTVYGTGGTVRINAHVGGDVSVRTGESLTLGDSAEIVGNVSYKSNTELTRAQGAVVTGTITRDTVLVESGPLNMEPVIINILILIFSSLTVFFLAKSRTDVLVENIVEGYGRLGLIGLGMMLALPMVSVVLMASVIGFLVGVILFLSYLVLVVLAIITMPIVLGALVQRIAHLGYSVTIYTVLIGVFALIVIPFVPYIGALALLLGFVILLGALCNELYRFFKQA